MTWLKVDDEFPENDKVWHLSDLAFRLYVSGNCYAVKKLSDGWVPSNRIATLVPHLRKAKDTVAELVSAHLWHETSKACSRCYVVREEKRVTDPLPRGGYLIHDFLVYNPPKWKVKAERDAKRRAGEAGGQASAQARAQASAQADTQAGSAEHGAQARTPYPVPRTSSIEERGLRPLSSVLEAVVRSAAERTH